MAAFGIQELPLDAEGGFCSVRQRPENGLIWSKDFNWLQKIRFVLQPCVWS